MTKTFSKFGIKDLLDPWTDSRWETVIELRMERRHKEASKLSKQILEDYGVGISIT